MDSKTLSCRSGCGACCIAPSISSPLPGFPEGKVANVPCPYLDEEYRCRIFGLAERPEVCGSLQPTLEMCGQNRAAALAYLEELERLTAPEVEEGAENA